MRRNFPLSKLFVYIYSDLVIYGFDILERQSELYMYLKVSEGKNCSSPFIFYGTFFFGLFWCWALAGKWNPKLLWHFQHLLYHHLLLFEGSLLRDTKVRGEKNRKNNNDNNDHHHEETRGFGKFFYLTQVLQISNLRLFIMAINSWRKISSFNVWSTTQN